MIIKDFVAIDFQQVFHMPKELRNIDLNIQQWLFHLNGTLIMFVTIFKYLLYG